MCALRCLHKQSKKHINTHRAREMCDFTRLSDIWLTFILIFVGSCMRVNMWICAVCALCVDLFRLILPIFIFRRRIQWILFDTWTYVEFLWPTHPLCLSRSAFVSFWFHFISFSIYSFWHFGGALLAHTALMRNRIDALKCLAPLE